VVVAAVVDDGVLDVIDRKVIDDYHKIEFAELNHAGIVAVVVAAVGSEDFVMLHAPLVDIELMLVAVVVEMEPGIGASAVPFDPKTECAYEKEESEHKDWKLNSAADFGDVKEESEIQIGVVVVDVVDMLARRYPADESQHQHLVVA
jgi:hypothetical protein